MEPAASSSGGGNAVLDWNFENDLELLKLKLSRCQLPLEETRKLRDVITGYLGDELTVGDVGTERNSTDTNVLAELGVTKASIERVIYLMLQFQKQCKDQDVPLNLINQVSTASMTNPEPNAHDEDEPMEEVSVSGVSVTDFKRVILAFKEFFQKRLTDTVQVSPLSNELILSEIVKYLRVEDLCQMRLVNRICNDSSTVSLKRRKINVSLRRQDDCTRFCKEISVPESFPITSFSIKLTDHLCEHEHYLAFLAKFGPHVKDLNIYCEVTEFVISDLQSMLRTTFQSVPRLRTLTLNLPHMIVLQPLSFNEEEIAILKLMEVESLTYHWCLGGQNPKFFESLLTLLPNLESLNIIWRAGDVDTPQPMYFHNLKLRNLKCTEITRMPVQNLILFQHQKLQTLDIRVAARNVDDASTYATFFQSQSASLETLIVQGDGNEPPVRIDISSILFEKLQNLMFHCNGVGGLWPLEPLPYRVPNLRKLDISLDLLDNFFQQDSIYCTVKEVRARRWGWSDRFRENLKRLPELFPNLKKLKIGPSGIGLNELHIIFTHFQNLEQLDLLITEKDEQNINMVLSGMDAANEWIHNHLLGTANSVTLEPPFPPLCKI